MTRPRCSHGVVADELAPLREAEQIVSIERIERDDGLIGWCRPEIGDRPSSEVHLPEPPIKLRCEARRRQRLASHVDDAVTNCSNVPSSKNPDKVFQECCYQTIGVDFPETTLSACRIVGDSNELRWLRTCTWRFLHPRFGRLLRNHVSVGRQIRELKRPHLMERNEAVAIEIHDGSCCGAGDTSRLPHQPNLLASQPLLIRHPANDTTGVIMPPDGTLNRRTTRHGP